MPLSSFLRFDPWTDQVVQMHAAYEPLLSSRDKMPFEVTPVYLKLSYYKASADAGAAAAAAAGATTTTDANGNAVSAPAASTGTTAAPVAAPSAGAAPAPANP
jgi:hypothetical protein